MVAGYIAAQDRKAMEKPAARTKREMERAGEPAFMDAARMRDELFTLQTRPGLACLNSVFVPHLATRRPVLRPSPACMNQPHDPAKPCASA